MRKGRSDEATSDNSSALPCRLLRGLAPREVWTRLDKHWHSDPEKYLSLPTASLHPERVSRWLVGYTSNQPGQGLVSGRGYRPFVVLGLLFLTANVVVAAVTRVLLQSGKPAVEDLFEGRSSSGVVTHLSGDPLGAVVILVCCFAPILFALQTDAIRAVFQMNRRNAHLLTSRDTSREVVRHVNAANGWFKTFGSRPCSFVCLLVACSIAVASLCHFKRTGIYDSQLINLLLPVAQTKPMNTHHLCHMLVCQPVRIVPSLGGRVEIRTIASIAKMSPPPTHGMLYYNGWWAAWPFHKVDTTVLGITIAYMAYYIIKGVLMGVAFFRYSYRTFGANFPVTAYPFVNFDRYDGLRELRLLLVWTYVATMLNLGLFFAIFVVATWLSPLVIVAGVIVSLAPVPIVYVPTWLAKIGLSRSAQNWIVLVSHSNGPGPPTASRGGGEAFDTADAQYATSLDSGRGREVASFATDVWSRSVLPFHPVSVLSAILLQVVIPLAAVLVPIVASR